MTTLLTLETEYQFRYPPLYHRLAADHRLQFIYGDNWLADIYPVMAAHPPLLFYAIDFWVLSPSDVAAKLRALNAENDYRRMDKRYRFIPFGKNKAGDLFCFDVTAQQGTDAPVILLPHDSDKASCLAASLGDFIFITLLETLNDIWPHALLRHLDFPGNCIRMVQEQQEWLSAAQFNALQAICLRAAGVNASHETSISLLDDAELVELINTYAPYPQHGQRFIFCLPEPAMPVRRCGTLMLTMPSAPASNSLAAVALKALNWRQDKQSSTPRLLRKNSVFFELAQFEQLNSAVKQHLAVIFQYCADVELIFMEDGQPPILLHP